MQDIDDEAKPNVRAGTAVRKRGKARANDILAAAKEILVSEGMGALSTRRVADQLGISVGNLAYYYPSKDALLQAMIEHVIDGYDAELRRDWESFPDDPQGRFKAFLTYMIEDAKKPDVQGFFYQFWGYSSHNQQAAVTRRAMYQHFLAQTVDLLKDLHPAKKKPELEDMGMGVLTCLEGLHVIYGSGDNVRIRSGSYDRHILNEMLRMAGVEGQA